MSVTSERPALGGRHRRAAGPATVAEPVAPMPPVVMVSRLVAAGLVVVTGTGIPLMAGVPAGLAAALALAPVWVPRFRAYSGGVAFALLVLLCLGSGFWLTGLAAGDHEVVGSHMRLWTVLVLSLVTTVGVVLWARSQLSDAAVASLYGLGMLLGAVVLGPSASNPWKGGYSLPLTILLLGLAWMARRRWLELGVAVLLGGISALNDSRSHFAMLLLTAALVFWQMAVRGRGRARAAWRSLVVLGGVGWGIYMLGQAMMLEGHLGEETQQRTAAQIEASGSILLGGRPELGATVALMQFRPYGFGFGTLPTVEEISVAKTGMASLNYDPNNGYVENYMFGELVKLHSVVGDAWSMFGVAGLLLCGLVIWAVLRRVVTDLPARTLSAVVVFLAARVIWDMGFGPLYSGLPVLALGVGMVLRPVVRTPRHAPPDLRPRHVAAA